MAIGMDRLRSSSPFAIVSLLAANIFAAWFAAEAGVKPAELLFLYWVETWVIAGYTVLKIKKAALSLTEHESRFMRIQFLAPRGNAVTRESILVTFVRQCIAVFSVYGALLFGILVPAISVQGGGYGTRVLTAFPSSETWLWFLSSLLGLIASHGVSYFSNFWGKGEFMTTSPARQMLQLGDRLIAMHLFLVFGFPILGNLGDIGVAAGYSHGAAIIGMVFIKLIADLATHSKEHMVAQALGMAKQGSIPKFLLKFKRKPE